VTRAGPKPNLQEKLALIARFLERGDLASAEAVARPLLAAYPRRAEANHALGRVLMLAGRPELAEPLLDRAAAAEKASVDIRLDLGQCLLMMGRVPEAAAQFERAAALAPGSYRVNGRLGSYLLGIGRGEEALAAFNAALAAAPSQEAHAIHLEKVECLLSLARVEEAEAEIRSQAARHALQQPLRGAALAGGEGRCGLARVRPHRAGTGGHAASASRPE